MSETRRNLNQNGRPLVTVEGCIAQARAIAPQAPLVTLIEWKVALEHNHSHLLAGETGDHCPGIGQEVKQIRKCRCHERLPNYCKVETWRGSRSLP